MRDDKLPPLPEPLLFIHRDTLAEMLAAATPGPWVVCPDPPPNDYWLPGFTVGAADPKDARRVCDASLMDWAMGRANAALIVALRNAAPALLARLEAAEAVVEAARAMVSERVVRRGPDDAPAPRQAPDIQGVIEAIAAYDQAKE